MKETTTSSLDLLWGTGERPGRGPKPGLTLDRIVTAAVAVADAEGLDAVSMRRVSAELGVGTMSLYRYVPGKAELLDLMLDRVQGESFEKDPEPPTHWRETVTKLARSSLDLYRAHPWLMKVNQARSLLGPSALRGLELCLSGLKGPHGMGLSDPETISVIITVQSYAAGLARMEIQTAEAARETGVGDTEFWRRQQPYLERAMASGDYPLMAALADDTFSTETDHFAFGLERLLDGFEVLVSRGAGGASRR
ncbi:MULTISPECIES: TetR/AcrR family transcriptional regulator [Streptomyces]|uniref:TetR/AcrR family transcriptional regulator n=1 Tax=Streptomyces TaxID=1883 RepID=UPI001318BEAC|nr:MULTISPECIES: TetR/AcrR family transcriptional regulator [Streptomyces]QGZ50252.1 TetR family transcriptional regulator [Streptomyces sp. QHH-9511]GGU02954.1 TetR family transcriptional regulator [Streptomyces lateritius]